MESKMKNAVYQGLKQHVKSKSMFDPYVYELPAGEVYPKVIFTKISDKSLAVNDPLSFVGFEINIYAVDQSFNGETVAGISICEELEDIVNEYMCGIMKFRRIMSQPVPNIDNNIQRILMQFVTTASDSRCHFFK